MGYYYYYGFDPLYFLILISVVIAMVAQYKVKSTYSKYSRVRSDLGLTGAQAAQKILNMNGIYDVSIQHIAGDLTDNYNPRNKVLSLSDAVYNSTSIAAIGVAAHECGHAIQHDVGYTPLLIRNTIAPVVNIASSLSWIFIAAGLFFGMSPTLIDVGIIMFSLAVLFELITLPVEFNASGRALTILSDSGMLYPDETAGAKKVLSAAAMTYVASALTAVLQLLRLIMLFGRRSDDR
ncbi:MAG: zinc metallopeptidase [[Bacteroides] pectinophilus]|nr:zinc metallopeptidase [[Bacteroides] pectinophilus]